MILGPLLMLIIKFMPSLEGLHQQGQSALAVLVFCVIWWLFTPVALPVTSLLGLALLPLMGAVSIEDAFSLFGNQAVFFVMGVFLVASIMLQTGLSARLALIGLRRVSDSEEKLCNGVLFLSWILCSFLVSHAVAALFLPMILGLLKELQLSYNSRFAKRILLSMAWGTVCGSNLGLLSSARASLSLELYDNYREEMIQGPEPIGILDFFIGDISNIIFFCRLCRFVLQYLYPSEGVQLHKAVLSLDQQLQKEEIGPNKKTYCIFGITDDMYDDLCRFKMVGDHSLAFLWCLFRSSVVTLGRSRKIRKLGSGFVIWGSDSCRECRSYNRCCQLADVEFDSFSYYRNFLHG